MKFRSLFLCALAGLSLAGIAANTAFADTSGGFSPAQQQAIQQIVHDYLLQNPRLLLQVAQELQKQQIEEQTQKAMKAIVTNAQGLFHDSSSPTVGNTQGKVAIVEFFDYQCPHCKKMSPIMEDLMKKNPQLQVIYKQMPIFPGSEIAAKYALAAAKQSKFNQFHLALMNATNPMTKDKLIAIAKSVGLDVDKLQQDANDPSINAEIQNNMQLANALNLMGTPALIVASNVGGKDMKTFFIPGESQEAELQKDVSEALNASKHS